MLTLAVELAFSINSKVDNTSIASAGQAACPMAITITEHIPLWKLKNHHKYMISILQLSYFVDSIQSIRRHSHL